MEIYENRKRRDLNKELQGDIKPARPGVNAVCDVRCGAKSQFEVRLNLSLKATPSDYNCIKLI